MRDLVERAKTGDLDAFGVLVSRYKDMAYGTSYAILGNFHDAQDAAQDALIQAWRKLDGLKNCDGFPAWLCRITRNLSLDRVRGRHGGTDPIEDVADTLPDTGNTNPRTSAERSELHETIQEAIRSLSEPNRLATALFYINGYSVDEVADFLEVPAGTVKRRLHDSRTQLRERMADMIEDTFKSNPLPADFSHATLKKIGDFACLDIIGTGGMGSVYLAEHPVLKHNVAIKILANGGKGFFDRSRRILEKLNHPGFVKVFSYGEHEGHPYVVFEYFQSALQLRAWLNRPETRGHWDLLQTMVQMANAIAYAHGRGIVVGYIEPNNHILVLANGAPVLLDGGLFQDAQQNHFEEMEAYPSRYLAPECIKGEPPTKETDIWNLGVLMHENLVEKPLFEGETGEDVRRAILAPDPVDLHALKEVAPDYIVPIVEKCLRKAPEERFSSMTEFRDALEDALFADLVRLKDYDAERLLRDVEHETLVAALTGVTGPITAHMLGHVPDKTAKQIHRLITVNASAADAAHAARREIVATATRLLQELRIGF